MSTPTTAPSALRRREIIAALRNGTVPRRGVEVLASGLDRYVAALDDELDHAAQGFGVIKAVRGEYGGGKTFFARWLEHRAMQRGFAVAEVQISETETPLHQMGTVYRRAMEALRTAEWEEGAFRNLVGRWFFSLEEEVLLDPEIARDDAKAVTAATGELLERRLARVGATQGAFAAALRECHRARVEGDHAVADGLLAWLMGQPNVGAAVKRAAGIKGEIDHETAGAFLRGMLVLLAQSGRKGLLLVLDEAETIQRMRSDVRERSLNALRQLIDDIASNSYPGLYLLITGTPPFFEGPQGIKRLPPLAQRLHEDFAGDPRFDNPRAAQVRLLPFDRARMMEVGRRVRDLYPAKDLPRMQRMVDDALLGALADKVTGALGGKVGVAPRLFLKKLVGSILDRVDAFEDFDPRVHADLTVATAEMSADEASAAGVVRDADALSAVEGLTLDDPAEPAP
ncbi:MAG: BREX system ATP-binding protein BrxD [Deltaproteobacteria bacterium]|nr:BREX system ATP-binding protein BrxD [Deltaproteobacteria bacterium]